MKKIAFGFLSFLFIFSMLAFSIKAEAATPNWNTTGNYVVSFEYMGLYYNHDMSLSQDGLGNVSGNGGYPTGGPFAYTWDIDAGSTVNNNTIHLNTHYTLGAVCSMTIDGTIDLLGNMSGTWSDDCGGPRNGTWSTVSGSATAVVSNAVVVHPVDMALNIGDVIATPTKWFFYNDESDMIDNTLGSFVAGPAIAPAGMGSAQMSVIGTQRRNIATYQFKDVKLSDITDLSFSTYSQLAGDGALGLAERAPYLQFNVDFNNSDTWQRRLVYVPGVNGVVTPDTWQSWDAINNGNALWLYSGATWPTTTDAGSTPKTWAQILALYPNAETRSTDSWLGFRVGEPYANGFTGNIDKFVFGTVSNTTTFDFEPENEGPVTSNVMVVSSMLTANVDDSTKGNSNIASAEYKIDGGSWTPMVAEDGAFDGVSENVKATLPVLGAGTHNVCVRGTDVLGNVGVESCTSLTMTTVVSGGGNIALVPSKPSGKKAWTFGFEVNVDPQNNPSGGFNVVDHTINLACNYTTISDLSIVGNTATFTASGASVLCMPSIMVTINDLGEPGALMDTIAISPAFTTPKVITGGNFQVKPLPTI